MTDAPTRDFDDLLLGRSGPPAAKFARPGDKIRGTLVGKDTQHKSKFNPKDPSDKSDLMFFKSGDPVLELILTLQTELRDPAKEGDKGLRRVYVPFQMQQSLQQAVADAGIKRTLPLGSVIEIEFTHEVPNALNTGNPRKEYKVTVTAPSDLVAVGAGPVVASGGTAGGGGQSGPVLTEATKELMRQNNIPVPGE